MTAPVDVTVRARQPWASRRKVVLGLLVLAIALFAAAAPTWVTATGDSASGPVTTRVSGTTAAPGVGATALIVAAAALALALSGRVAQRVVAVVVVLAGVLAAASAWAVVSDPEAPGAAAVSKLTGVARTTEVSTSGGPVASIVVAAVVALVGAYVAVRRLTPRGASRYDVAAPTAPAPGEVAPGGIAPSTDDAGRAGPVVTSTELWDSLSRGDDPT